MFVKEFGKFYFVSLEKFDPKNVQLPHVKIDSRMQHQKIVQTYLLNYIDMGSIHIRLCGMVIVHASRS